MVDETVLVTGGSGFIGAHCILRLLQDGYRVRTTVRSLSREDEVRAMLAQGGAAPDADVAFVAADLTSDDGWADAVAGSRVRAARRLSVPARCPQARGRADRAGAGGRAPRAAGRPRRRRAAGRAHVLHGGHRVRTAAADGPVHGGRLDRCVRRRECLHEVEDPGRARHVGLRRRGWTRARRRQPGRGLRAGARGRLLDVDRACLSADAREDARPSPRCPTPRSTSATSPTCTCGP